MLEVRGARGILAGNFDGLRQPALTATAVQNLQTGMFRLAPSGCHGVNRMCGQCKGKRGIQKVADRLVYAKRSLDSRPALPRQLDRETLPIRLVSRCLARVVRLAESLQVRFFVYRATVLDRQDVVHLGRRHPAPLFIGCAGRRMQPRCLRTKGEIHFQPEIHANLVDVKSMVSGSVLESGGSELLDASSGPQGAD